MIIHLYCFQQGRIYLNGTFKKFQGAHQALGETMLWVEDPFCKDRLLTQRNQGKSDFR